VARTANIEHAACPQITAVHSLDVKCADGISDHLMDTFDDCIRLRISSHGNCSHFFKHLATQCKPGGLFTARHVQKEGKRARLKIDNVFKGATANVVQPQWSWWRPSREQIKVLLSRNRGLCVCRQSQRSRAGDNKSFCSFRLGERVALVHSLQAPFVDFMLLLFARTVCTWLVCRFQPFFVRARSVPS
jgi:hypothetical protein